MMDTPYVTICVPITSIPHFLVQSPSLVMITVVTVRAIRKVTAFGPTTIFNIMTLAMTITLMRATEAPLRIFIVTSRMWDFLVRAVAILETAPMDIPGPIMTGFKRTFTTSCLKTAIIPATTIPAMKTPR
jgi:hypothetical protein